MILKYAPDVSTFLDVIFKLTRIITNLKAHICSEPYKPQLKQNNLEPVTVHTCPGLIMIVLSSLDSPLVQALKLSKEQLETVKLQML